MNRFISLMCLGMIGFTVSASARESLIESQLRRSGINAAWPLTRKAIVPQCANFSGVWKGTCVDQKTGRSEVSDMTIGQSEGCRNFYIDGMNVSAEGANTMIYYPGRDAIERWSSNLTLRADWNDSQSKLHLLINVTGDAGAIVITWAKSLWLSNGQLHYNDEYKTKPVTPKGALPFDIPSYQCTYDLQP